LEFNDEDRALLEEIVGEVREKLRGLEDFLRGKFETFS